jgi:hypothetical protein
MGEHFAECSSPCKAAPRPRPRQYVSTGCVLHACYKQQQGMLWQAQMDAQRSACEVTTTTRIRYSVPSTPRCVVLLQLHSCDGCGSGRPAASSQRG